MMAGEVTERVTSRWVDALTAARLFAIDPAGLRGIALRAGPGPVRDVWLEQLRGSLEAGTPVRRMPAGIEDGRLLGGVDLAATLQCGRPVVQNGLLAEADGGVVLIAMAERLSAAVAARIANVLDRGEVPLERDGVARRIATRIGVVALDEGATAEEQLPAVLAGRFAFHIDLGDVGMRELAAEFTPPETMQMARARLAAVESAPEEFVEALVATAASFGIASVVPPLLALRATRCAAALAGRTRIVAEDAALAARLVLAPRALCNPNRECGEDVPEDSVEPRQDPPIAEDEAQNEQDKPENLADLEDVLREAMQAALPSGLLETLAAGTSGRSPPSRRGGVGATQESLLRGRPAGVRTGRMRPGARLALVETLRAAAPWQPVRRAEMESKAKTKRIEVRREDFRIRRFAQRRESTIVFCVDASGSSAFHRLAEAKGAVELLLGEAYIARTYAGLIAFRGRGAQLLLPPSRSLTRAKALLSTLPGGGGTPLAAGIDAAVAMALAERAKGRDPLIVLLTDGRANIARDGRAVRATAAAEALAASTQLHAQRLASVFIDTAPRARDEGGRLAAAMGARYVALPHAEASVVRDVVRAAAA